MPVRPSPMCWIWCSPGKGSVGRISSSLISPGLILSAWRGVSREKCGIHPLFLCAGVPDIAISPGRFPAGQRPFRKTDLIFLMARKRAGTWDECCTFPGHSSPGGQNPAGRGALMGKITVQAGLRICGTDHMKMWRDVMYPAHLAGIFMAGCVTVQDI